MSLGGARLDLQLSSSFTTTAGEQFDIIEASSAPVVGTFAGLQRGAIVDATTSSGQPDQLSIRYDGGQSRGEIVLTYAGPARFASGMRIRTSRGEIAVETALGPEHSRHDAAVAP